MTLCKASAQFAAAFTSALITGATSNTPPLSSGVLPSWVGLESGLAEISTWERARAGLGLEITS